MRKSDISQSRLFLLRLYASYTCYQNTFLIDALILSIIQKITERVHIEKRYGPRRQSTSPIEDRDIEVQIRSKYFLIFLDASLSII